MLKRRMPLNEPVTAFDAYTPGDFIALESYDEKDSKPYFIKYVRLEENNSGTWNTLEKKIVFQRYETEFDTNGIPYPGHSMGLQNEFILPYNGDVEHTLRENLPEVKNLHKYNIMKD